MVQLAELNLKLYKISTDEVESIDSWPEYFMGYKLIVYKPGLFSRPEHGTNFIRNLLWNIISLKRYTILLLYDNDILVHSKGITCKTYRFGYMGKNDLHHQQAFTNPDYRCKGILTNILKLIPSYYKKDHKLVWVYCDVVNTASQKAIEKAGYKFVSYAKMNTFTKIVRLVDKL
jgi:RimJ/RimL family protein N-acetyltransferase